MFQKQIAFIKRFFHCYRYFFNLKESLNHLMIDKIKATKIKGTNIVIWKTTDYIGV